MRQHFQRTVRHPIGPFLLALFLAVNLAPGTLLAGEVPVANHSSASVDWESKKRDSAVSSVAALEELAKLCNKGRAQLERDLTYEAIIDLDPDNKKARKGLGWSWDRKAEEWTRRKEYKAPVNKKPDFVEQAIERRNQILNGHRDLILGLLRDTEGITNAARSAELARLLEASPDDAVLRELVGDVRGIGRNGKARWIYWETKQAKEARRALGRHLTRLTEEVALGELEPEDWESELGLGWNSSIATTRVKVLSTSRGNREVERVARHVHAIFDLLPPLVGGDTPAPEGFHIYMIETVPERGAFLGGYPDLKPEDRAAFAELDSGWLVWGRLGCWNPGEPQRVDSAIRQTVSFYLWRGHGITGTQGWIEQGLGLYLTYSIIGTRLSFAVANKDGSSANQPDWAREIHNDESDFLDLARRMLKAGEGPRVPSTLGRNVSSMTTEDLLFSYALGAYLVEGHPVETASEILTRCGAGEAAVMVLEDVLEMDIKAIEARVYQWLRQVR